MILMVCTVLKFILPMKMLNLGMDRMVKLVALRTFSRSFFSDRSGGQTYPRVMHSSSRLQGEHQRLVPMAEAKEKAIAMQKEKEKLAEKKAIGDGSINVRPPQRDS